MIGSPRDRDQRDDRIRDRVSEAVGSYQRIIKLKDERIKAAEREAFGYRDALREIETMPLPHHETVKAIARKALEK